MRAGSVAALASTADRHLSQNWSRYFNASYPQIDGRILKIAGVHAMEAPPAPQR